MQNPRTSLTYVEYTVFAINTYRPTLCYSNTVINDKTKRSLQVMYFMNRKSIHNNVVLNYFIDIL